MKIEDIKPKEICSKCGHFSDEIDRYCSCYRCHRPEKKEMAVSMFSGDLRGTSVWPNEKKEPIDNRYNSENTYRETARQK